MLNFFSWSKFVELFNPNRGCFIFRPVVNATQLSRWAQDNNVGGEYIPPDKLRVIVMYSTADIRNHKDFRLLQTHLTIDPSNFASCLQRRRRLGEDGAVVLKFQEVNLFERWLYLVGLGAIWTYPTYVPHVTLSYKTPENGWWTTVIPCPNFPLILGPEKVENLKQ